MTNSERLAKNVPIKPAIAATREKYKPMTNIAPKTSLSSVIASAWLAVAVIFSGVFVIEERDHDCPGETCHVCQEIQIAQRLIEAFVRFGVSILVVGFVSYTKPFIKLQTFFYQVSPIELKVKLNC